jgi:hypothetical protein
MSVVDLAKLITPPSSPNEAPQQYEWPQIEAQLGTSFPGDYKDFISLYGTGKIDSFWPDEFDAYFAGVSAVVENEAKGHIAEGIAEIEHVLEAQLNEGELRSILTDRVGCYFEPASVHLSYVQWLGSIRDILKKAMPSV